MNYRDFYAYLLPREQINEVHFSDIWPKGFLTFYEKWKKRKNETNLYVRFDNGNSMDSLSRAPSKTPSHKDMMGVYAYPLKYVIDFPGDIWYGHNSKFIKVIEDRSKSKIVLSNMEEWHANSLLRKAGLPDSLWQAKQYYPERAKGVTGAGKLFMSAILMNFDDADSPKSIKKNRYRNDIKTPVERSPKEQTDLLLKMKVDAIEDKSTTIKRASINDREPEQICWIKPTAFKILETFRMSDPSNKTSNVTVNLDKTKRKIASKISELIGDKLVTTDTFNLFWTRDGRMLEISDYDSSLQHRMKNLKMGQKDHKMYGKTDKTGFKINIKSERGEFNLSISSEDKIDTELHRFVQWWDKNREINTGEKYSHQKHKDKEKSDKDAWAKQENDRYKKQIIDGWGGFVSRFNLVAEKFNIPKITKELSDDAIANTYKLCMTKSSKLIEYFPDADVEIFENYMKMIDILEKNDIKLSRIPEHNLSDLLNIKI